MIKPLSEKLTRWIQSCRIEPAYIIGAAEPWNDTHAGMIELPNATAQKTYMFHAVKVGANVTKVKVGDRFVATQIGGAQFEQDPLVWIKEETLVFVIPAAEFADRDKNGFGSPFLPATVS